MTPKEKAKQLYDRYLEIAKAINNFKEHFGVDDSSPLFNEFIKECGLTAVNNIINSTKNRNQTIHFMPCNSSDCGCIAYWEQVKHEIQEL